MTQSLLSRLESLTGPDREIDGEIALACTWFSPTEIIEQSLPNAGTSQARADAEDLVAALANAGYATIPRSQYEALMGAATFARALYDDEILIGGWKDALERVDTSLRSVGIEIEGER